MSLAPSTPPPTSATSSVKERPPIASRQASALTVSDARLIQSRQFCEQLTRKSARNFYYGLKLLPEPKRSAMFALYAYMRLVDDIADGDAGQTPSQRADELEQWRCQTHAVMAGHVPDADRRHDLWPAVQEMVQAYRLPAHLFDDVIAGQHQDLNFSGFADFEALREYCYRVAGVVGLASIYIWGFVGEDETRALAIERGLAFQLTNILRDLREDAANNRIYLPADELDRFGVSPDDLRNARGGNKFLELMQFQIERASAYYLSSAPLDERVSSDSRPTLITMTEIYRRLLRKVAQHPERVLHERISLSLLSKLRIGWRAARRRNEQRATNNEQ